MDWFLTFRGRDETSDKRRTQDQTDPKNTIQRRLRWATGS